MTDPRQVLGVPIDAGSQPELDLDALRRRTGQLRRRRRSAVAVAGSLLVVGALAGSVLVRHPHHDSERLVSPVSSASPTSRVPAPTAGPSTGATEAPDRGSTSQVPPQPAFVANTEADRGTSSGGGLALTSIRVARQDGYDRVVYEFSGPATSLPGWNVAYNATPTRDFSGLPVQLQGSATLEVSLRGLANSSADSPPFSGQLLPTDTVLLREVLTTPAFEAQAQSFIGLDSQAPFRVFRLTGPTRVVVDVLTP